MSDLKILSETTMVEIPRGKDVLHVTFTKAKTPEGMDVAWHSIRVFWKADDGKWLPGKQGVTIRGGELRAVAQALAQAISGGKPAEPREQKRLEVDSDDVPF